MGSPLSLESQVKQLKNNENSSSLDALPRLVQIPPQTWFHVPVSYLRSEVCSLKLLSINTESETLSKIQQWYIGRFQSWKYIYYSLVLYSMHSGGVLLFIPNFAKPV